MKFSEGLNNTITPSLEQAQKAAEEKRKELETLKQEWTANEVNWATPPLEYGKEYIAKERINYIEKMIELKRELYFLELHELNLRLHGSV